MAVSRFLNTHTNLLLAEGKIDFPTLRAFAAVHETLDYKHLGQGLVSLCAVLTISGPISFMSQ